MKFLLIFLFIFSIQSLALVDDSVLVRLKMERMQFKLDQMDDKLDSIAEYNRKLVDNNYSLRNRLMEYEVKDDFFDSAFSSQTYRFTIIVAILFTLTIILVYASFNYQSKLLNDKFGGQILSQKQSFVDLRGRMEDLEYGMYISLGNISNLLSEFHLKNKNPFLSIKYALISANYIYQATKIDNRKRDDKRRWESACLAMLVIAFETLSKLKIDENYIEAFVSQQNELFEQLNGVARSSNNEIYEFAAKIKLKIKEIIKN